MNRNEMVIEEAAKLKTLLEERGIGKVISYAADMIVNLKMMLPKSGKQRG